MVKVKMNGDDFMEFVVCRLMLAKQEYEQYKDGYNSIGSTYATTWGDAAWVMLFHAVEKGWSKNVIKLDVSKVEYTEWAERAKSLRVKWFAAIRGDSFKRLIKTSDQLGDMIDEFLEWVPPEYIPTPGQINEAGKP